MATMNQGPSGTGGDFPASLIAADRVEGTTVYNHAGDTIGEIETVMLDKVTGKVAYAVMSFGGFLGIGERYHPLPWSMLRYDIERGGYVVNLDKKILEGAPNYRMDEAPDYADREWGRRLHEYYQVPPYWT